VGLAGSPNVTPPHELVAAAIANPTSILALAVGQNPKLVPTPELIAAAIANPNSRLALGLAGSPGLFIWGG
jgi:hypothetical protein